MVLATDNIFFEVDDWLVVAIERSSGLFGGHHRNRLSAVALTTHWIRPEGFISPHRSLHGRGVTVRLCCDDGHLSKPSSLRGSTNVAAYTPVFGLLDETKLTEEERRSPY